MKQTEQVKEWGGWLNRYQHPSEVCDCDMQFSVYLPPQAAHEPVPTVYWLSGLTCNDDNFRVKAGAQRYAAQHGIALVMPDTSPRGDKVPDAKDRYDLGQGAGFYVNATQMPWVKHYQMYDYVTQELPGLVEKSLPLIPGLKSIAGHSMGGHGALICGLKETGAYQFISAFSPICHPVICGWGEGCFGAYLGKDKKLWELWDATHLVESGATAPAILIDQGTNDEFLAGQLYPDVFQKACDKNGLELQLRMQDGYDHSYHFISSFIGEHLKLHADALKL
ncbi:MAG: S-formylglutathione hydrolase [Gammaproteobacteria bacterium]